LGCPTPTSPPPPEPNFGVSGATTGTVPFTVQFLDQSKGNIATWAWTFGDGGTSNAQNPSYTYNNPSYQFDGSNICFTSDPYNVSLTVSNSQKLVSAEKENFITVLPREFSIRLQPEPYALKNVMTLQHLPGCSQVCSKNFSGQTVGGSCLTSIASSQYDEIGYYFSGQMMALQVPHQVLNCPGGSNSAQAGIWEFNGWSETFLNSNDVQISQPAGDHNPKFEVTKDLYIIAYYRWVSACP
jgi:PKD repeat protein